MTRCTRQHSQIASPLNRLGQGSLMLRTGPASPSRHNLALTGNIAGQHGSIFIIYLHAPLTEGTDRRPSNEVSRASWPSCRSSSRSSDRSSGWSSCTSQILFSFTLLKGQIFGLNLPLFGNRGGRSPAKKKYTIRSHFKAGARLPILSFPIASM
jgi:hypothetical protein